MSFAFLPPPKSVVFATALSCLLLWETLRPRARFSSTESGGGRLRHGLRNLALGGLNVAAAGVMLAWLPDWSREAPGALSGWHESVAGWGGAFAILDGWMYLWHRLAHAVPWLWRLHRVHHSDRALDSTSAVRFHAGEVVLSNLARLPLLWALGIAAAQVVAYETLMVALVLFHHSNISTGKMASLLGWALVTPEYHRVHHHEDERYTNSNYGVVCSLWDRAFGSYQRAPAKLTLGLGEHRPEEEERLLALLRMPWRG